MSATLTPLAGMPLTRPVHGRILFVDDEPEICKSLGRFLRTLGFVVTSAHSGAEAIGLVLSESFDLVICDVGMPGMDGIETVRRLRDSDADLAVLMLTGINDARLAVDSVTVGATDYLIKPIGLPALQEAVERALHRRRLLVEQRRVERMIREEVAERTAELEADRRELQALTVSVADALITAMEAKDLYLRGHSQRVAAMAAAVAEDMKLPLAVVEQVRLAGRLHDVGTIGLSEAVLNKPGPLTPEEVAHVRQHVRIGVEILRPLRHLGLALTFVQDHHEHWDGTGYPNGLQGPAISIGGRILAACDTFDALTSARSYQRQLGHAEALERMRGLCGTLIDPECFRSLASIVTTQQPLPFVDLDTNASDAAPAHVEPRAVPGGR